MKSRSGKKRRKIRNKLKYKIKNETNKDLLVKIDTQSISYDCRPYSVLLPKSDKPEVMTKVVTRTDGKIKKSYKAVVRIHKHTKLVYKSNVRSTTKITKITKKEKECLIVSEV